MNFMRRITGDQTVTGGRPATSAFQPATNDLLADPRIARAVVEHVSANIFVLDEQLVLRYLNPKAMETLKRLEPQLRPVTGLACDRLVGERITRFTRDPIRAERQMRDAGPVAHGVDLQIGELTLGAQVTRIPIPDGPTVYVMAWADITAKVGDTQRARLLAQRLGETQEVNSLIQSVAGATQQMAENAGDIARNAAEATETVARAVSSVEAANETMTRLGTASEQINDIVKTITLVADQTNLLALNATIEAARAGEAGKGFAVVAGEVKELSKQTKAATERINEMIAQVQALSESAILAIAGISAVVDQIDERQRSIAMAVREQMASNTDVSRNVAMAAQRAESIASFVAEHQQT
jgi:hypothetical protein